MDEKIASTTAYLASGSAIAFGLSANEIAAITGAAVAVLTFMTNLYFKYRHLKLATNQSIIDQMARDGLIERRKANRAGFDG